MKTKMKALIEGYNEEKDLIVKDSLKMTQIQDLLCDFTIQLLKLKILKTQS